jgi:hypothetical protein
MNLSNPFALLDAANRIKTTDAGSSSTKKKSESKKPDSSSGKRERLHHPLTHPATLYACVRLGTETLRHIDIERYFSKYRSIIEYSLNVTLTVALLYTLLKVSYKLGDLATLYACTTGY